MGLRITFILGSVHEKARFHSRGQFPVKTEEQVTRHPRDPPSSQEHPRKWNSPDFCCPLSSGFFLFFFPP